MAFQPKLFCYSVEPGLFLSPGQDLASWGHGGQGCQDTAALPAWHRNAVRRIRTTGAIRGV